MLSLRLSSRNSHSHRTVARCAGAKERAGRADVSRRATKRHRSVGLTHLQPSSQRTSRPSRPGMAQQRLFQVQLLWNARGEFKTHALVWGDMVRANAIAHVVSLFESHVGTYTAAITTAEL